VGESEDKQDDFLLSDVLKNISPRVILAYFFDPREGAPVFPLKILKRQGGQVYFVDMHLLAKRGRPLKL